MGVGHGRGWGLAVFRLIWGGGGCLAIGSTRLGGDRCGGLFWWSLGVIWASLWRGFLGGRALGFWGSRDWLWLSGLWLGWGSDLGAAWLFGILVFLEFGAVTCLGWAVDGFGFFSPAGAGFFWFGLAFGAPSLGASFLGAGLVSDGLRGAALVPALGCPSTVFAPVWSLPLLSFVNCPGKNPSNQANNSSTLLSCYFELRFCHKAAKNSPQIFFHRLKITFRWPINLPQNKSQ